MSNSQRVAIAAHLHVLLRRKTGRVTDTEWMAENLQYATEIIRYARERSQEAGMAELAEWANKLEQAVQAPAPGARPLAEAAMHLLRERQRAAPAPSPAAGGVVDTADARAESPAGMPRYVGGIR